MSQRCDICGKGPEVGHRVSHAHNLTNRRWMPNLQRVHIIKDGKPLKIMACTRCIRSGQIQKNIRKKGA
jgi:large subunit ribosomal protein L28